MLRLILYCTKQPPYLLKTTECLTDVCNKYFTSNNSLLKDIALNGKIVAECDYEVEKIEYYEKGNYHRTPKTWSYDLERNSCLNIIQIKKYLGENIGYAIHIKNLKERVMEFSDVYKYDNSYNNMFGWIVEENKKYIPLDKAPQNMMKVWIYENGEWVMYILISVRPEWLFLELKGEKTIEVRKKVLKEMMQDG